MEVPENLYLDVTSKHGESVFAIKNNDTYIQYTRIDAFIKKACEFLKNRIEHDSIDYPMVTKHLIEDFKKYMKD